MCYVHGFSRVFPRGNVYKKICEIAQLTCAVRRSKPTELGTDLTDVLENNDERSSKESIGREWIVYVWQS